MWRLQVGSVYKAFIKIFLERPLELTVSKKWKIIYSNILKLANLNIFAVINQVKINVDTDQILVLERMCLHAAPKDFSRSTPDLTKLNFSCNLRWRDVLYKGMGKIEYVDSNRWNIYLQGPGNIQAIECVEVNP